VQLAGHVQAQALAGDWQPHTRYTLVTANGGVQSHFDAVSTSLPFLSPALSYDATHAYLTLARNTTPLDSVLDDPGPSDVGDAIDTLEDSPSEPVRDAVLGMDAPQARTALNQLAGHWAPGIVTRLMHDSRYLRLAVLRQFQGIPGSSTGSASGNASGSSTGSTPGHGGWASTYGSFAQRSANGTAPADQRTLGGMVMGWRAPLRPGLNATAFAGLEQASFRQTDGLASAQASSVHLGAAVQRSAGWLELVAGIAHGWQHIKSQRKILAHKLQQWLAARYRLRTWQAFGEASAALYTPEQARRPINAIPFPALRAFARLAWVSVHSPAWREQGGTAALAYQSTRTHAVFSVLGLRAAHQWQGPHGLHSLNASVGWRHTHGALQPAFQAQFAQAPAASWFNTNGQGLVRNAIQAGLELTLRPARGARVGLAYTTVLARGNTDHAGMLDVRWAF
jgi:uncharacterized protein with beta-barrel porin domain